MEIKGKVVEINLDTQVPKNGGGTYPGATISFRDVNGKLQEKGFHANALKFNAALKNGLENLQAGDNFVANADKNDNGFWEWKSIAKAGAEAPKQATAQPNANAGGKVVSNNNNWATAEERAQTQVYIVRQSSLTNALKLFEIQGYKKATPEEVIEIAQEFEAFVLGIEKRPDIKPGKLAVVGGSDVNTNADPFDDIENDVPY